MTATRSISACMALVFAMAAALQWNDPDPLPWIAAYLAASYLAIRHAFGTAAPCAASAGLGFVLAVFALLLTPAVFEANAGAYTAFTMQDTTAEEARESLGLWLAVLYLGWLSVKSRHSASRA